MYQTPTHRLIREREAVEAYKERARLAMSAREGDDAVFMDDELHPDDRPDEVRWTLGELQHLHDI